MISEMRNLERDGDAESRKLYNFCLGGNGWAISANCSANNTSGTTEQKSMVYICQDGDCGIITKV